MRFGKTLREAIYPPWKEHYIDYAKLKGMLREDTADDEEIAWTDEDESRFCEEIFNVQLEKVAKFQAITVAGIEERVNAAFDKLKEIAPSDEDPDKSKSDLTTGVLKEFRAELDALIKELNTLKKFCGINYTGFLKIVKKHDRKRGDRYKIRPMMRVRLSANGFQSEEPYDPILKKLSLMYYIVNSNLDVSEQAQPIGMGQHEEFRHGERYTAHKFWVHPDNLLEVKTTVLRHLPALLYQQQDAKTLDGNEDLATTSLYFDNRQFDLYRRKVERQTEAASLRLRWYGQLNSKPDIVLEQKVVHESGGSEEKRFQIKDKYIKPFVDGEYKMEKTIQKMKRQSQDADSINNLKSTAEEIQEFIKEHKLEPVMRANYTRTAFQKPADDRVRVLIDNEIAFIREDVLDPGRPCRDPNEWHRRDVDSGDMTYPFPNINQGEISKFPFALLEIKLKEEEGKKKPGWIQELMSSHLVHNVPRFSKFVHGTASLFEDYVNNLPLWLSDLETDIRKDPQKAYDEEEQRKAQRAEDDQVVGSFLAPGTKRSSYQPAASSPLGKSYLSERAANDARQSNVEETLRNHLRGEGDGEGGEGEDERQGGGYGAISTILPSFSLSKLTQARRQKAAQLPEGVLKPEFWQKNQGELKIEPKVWLANERTFLKWQHICILLGSLAVSLYTAAGENELAEAMGIVFVVIAMLAGAWGYGMLRVRRHMIIERSGKDFDNWIGPLVVSAAMMLALVLNFVFAYQKAFAKMDQNGGGHQSELVMGGEL